MITHRFTTTGIILAGALLLATVHQSCSCSSLTNRMGSQLASEAVDKYKECQKAQKAGLSEFYSACIRDLMDKLLHMQLAKELSWNDCKKDEKPGLVVCKLRLNFIVHELNIPSSEFLNFTEDYTGR